MWFPSPAPPHGGGYLCAEGATIDGTVYRIGCLLDASKVHSWPEAIMEARPCNLHFQWALTGPFFIRGRFSRNKKGTMIKNKIAKMRNVVLYDIMLASCCTMPKIAARA